MDNQAQKFELRLGLFIAGGTMLFLLAIFIIGNQKNLFSPVFTLTSTFYNVSGLQVGNNIRFSGINVGTVNNISIINDSTVKIEMVIKKDVIQFIKSDCKVTIGSEGLIGDRILIITQGSYDAPAVKEGEQLASKEPVETDAILSSLKVTAGNAENISKNLSELTVVINSKNGILYRLIHDSTIVQNIDQTILNFRNSSKTLDGNMDVISKNLLTSLEVTAGNAQVASRQIVEFFSKINNNNGTLGRLIQDTSMIQNLEQTVLNLRNASQGLEENMKAAKQNFLFRGYFKKKGKEAEKARQDSIKTVTDEQKANLRMKK